ncbi:MULTISPECIES: presqualene diphosphate synthase HpnD [unclassified Cupriavidus]|uniref:presqualene diphosphate synthase HpnD n=1 Tax=unclassified Cupriavidus TaxID=2640874 RepID=UPI001C0072AE|nr:MULTISPECIES: presqualene diphosphate synthase HpnD [unclassified Cupriavidus]MCA3186474.1 presqualene diphosphate synthase HpnD [Cupriavidus sp.]MCA3188937.1 presqualene diphosphate synthase HpnD [Cupriavidus sp.]MCA3198656.1 presqualene diphosphate synthase HpnD [Cupriavidus sp.]MCA3201402.1 presqualene diphosphate synthase HpnD [Cupriavidus sp.]MCA3208698.1 presqualene diphosphate synthase HpnD [Cupriavidus sp.]
MAGTEIATPGAPLAGPAVSSGSSFHTAMRILPPSQRQAMFEIYAFCRAVDDIADGDTQHADRLAALEDWRADIAACYAGNAPAALRSLDEQIKAFNLQQQDFGAVIDGMIMDVVSTIVAPDAATLDLYCDRVASAVGRLAVRVFGLEEQPGIELAHHLGRALQLTNILRDLDEDAEIGRLYLPAEALAAAGIPAGTPRAVIDHPAIDTVCRGIARDAQAHYDASAAIMARCPSRVVRSPRIMYEVYHEILTRLLARGWLAPRTRVRVNKAKLAWIVLRHAIA